MILTDAATVAYSATDLAAASACAQKPYRGSALDDNRGSSQRIRGAELDASSFPRTLRLEHAG
jgi:hypothetical protein